MYSIPFPLVSVVVPAYNRRAYVCDAVDSALRQLGVDLEVIVVDDGSTDGTWDLLREAYEDDGRVFLVRQTNRGVAAARNEGIKRATGHLVVFLDSDDLLMPDALAVRAECLTRYPDAGVAFTDYARSLSLDTIEEASFFENFGFWDMLDDDMVSERSGSDALLLSRRFINLAATYCCVATPTAMVRRTAALECGGFDESLERCEDWDFFLRLINKTGAVCCGRTTALVRFWVAGLSGDGGMVARARLAALERHRTYVEDFEWRPRLENRITESQLAVGHFAARSAGYMEAARLAVEAMKRKAPIAGMRLLIRIVIERGRRTWQEND
jgi:glycosyltransferase involved in cell wall biosynthesis